MCISCRSICDTKLGGATIIYPENDSLGTVSNPQQIISYLHIDALSNSLLYESVAKKRDNEGEKIVNVDSHTNLGPLKDSQNDQIVSILDKSEDRELFEKFMQEYQASNLDN